MKRNVLSFLILLIITAALFCLAPRGSDDFSQVSFLAAGTFFALRKKVLAEEKLTYS